MRRLDGRWLTTLSACSVAISFPSLVHSQQNTLQELNRQLERSAQVVPALERWNAKTAIEKATFSAIIVQDIDRLGAEQGAAWVNARMQLWNSLPATLKPELPVTPGGQLFLLGSFAENQQEFERTVDDPERRGTQIIAKVYYALAVAQTIAQQRESERIEASHVFLATVRGSYSFWPFYCPPPPPKK